MSDAADRTDGRGRWYGLVLLVLASGCGPEATFTPEEAKALATAKAAIAAHPELRDYVNFDKPSGNPVTCRWSVSVSRNPQVQGGHVIVEIDRDGKVRKILPGL
jgi:hypothetical protein